MFEILLDQDPTPWFSAHTANLIGGYGGSAVGVLGAIVGSTAGTMVPKGKGRRFVLGIMTFSIVLGTIVFGVGITAVSLGQPYGIWYPLVMLGALPAGIMGALFPMVRRRYAEAEQRRLDADALRRS